ncbi:MAG: exo-alpha-sialidase [Bacteroidota bacterium]
MMKENFLRKIIFMVAAALLPAMIFGQVELGDIQNISNSTGTPSNEQNFVAEGSNYYLVWNQWGDVMFSMSDDAGDSWATPQTVYSAFDYGATYPVIAVSGEDVLIFYFRNTSGDSQIFMVKSEDGGQSFGDEQQVTNASNNTQTPQVIAEDGVFYLAYEQRDENSNYQIAFMKSSDAGESWTEPVFLSDTQSPSRWCSIDAADGSVYVAYNDETGENYDDLDLFFTKSEDEGASWSAPENISNNQEYNARMKIKVLDDMAYIVSSTNDGVQPDIRLYWSEDLGSTWMEPVDITDNSGYTARPDLFLGQNAVNDHRLYVVYSDDTYTGTELTYLKYSYDHGENWSEAIQVSEDIEDGLWPQIDGQQGTESDDLYIAWNMPPAGTFDYEVWGRSATSQFALSAQVQGTVTDLDQNPIEGAEISFGSGSYNTLTNSEGYFEVAIPGGEYTLSAEAEGYEPYYEEIEVEGGETYEFEIELAPYEPVMFPPLNLSYSIEASDVLLDWDEPASSGEEMRYDNGTNSDEVGGEPEHFEAAIRFTPSDLQQYEGKYLTEINFYNTDKNCQVFARVWTGGNQNYAGDLVFEQEVENLNENAWNRVELDQPLLIDTSQELWIGYKVLNPEGIYPAGTDNGPADPYKGDMILYYSDWVSMYDNFGWDINWNIYGLAVSTESPVENTLSEFSPLEANVDGYNIYKDGSHIDEVDPLQTNYTYEGIGEGLHTFYVTSTYEEWESNPSNEVEMVITSNRNNQNGNLVVGPNPAKEKLFIQPNGNQIQLLTLTDLNGREVIRKSDVGISQEFEIELPAELKGVYILRMETESGSFTEKVIIQ